MVKLFNGDDGYCSCTERGDLIKFLENLDKAITDHENYPYTDTGVIHRLSAYKEVRDELRKILK